MNGEAVVWWARLDDGASVDRFEAMLSPEERVRADAFRFQIHRRQFVVTRGLLRRLLGEYLRIDVSDVELAYGEHGKPRLANDDLALRFSVSHTEGLAVFAFSEHGEVGVDVEKLRADLAIDAIAQRLPVAEAAGIARCTGVAKLHAFFRAWVRSEAYAKGRGGGLDLLAESPDPERWSIVDLNVAEGYAAAVALEGRAPVRVVEVRL